MTYNILYTKITRHRQTCLDEPLVPAELNHSNVYHYTHFTLTQCDCVLCLVGVLVSSNLSCHFNCVPLTPLKIRNDVVESIWSWHGPIGCWWIRCDWYVGIVVALWCHGRVYSAVVVAGASAIVNVAVLLSITCNIGQGTHSVGCI